MLAGLRRHQNCEATGSHNMSNLERGRMERAIRYLRTSFFAAREFVDPDDINAQADVWCRAFVEDRCCPERSTHSVPVAFAEKANLLLTLPCNAYQPHKRVPVTAGKTPYVRFDWDNYSIPHTHVERQLTVLADLNEACIVDDQDVIDCHRRNYDKGAQI